MDIAVTAKNGECVVCVGVGGFVGKSRKKKRGVWMTIGE
jgi:hypothetical protein